MQIMDRFCLEQLSQREKNLFVFIERSGPLLLGRYKSTQTSSNAECLPVAEKDPPTPPRSFVYLSSSWGKDSLERRGTEVPAAA